MKNGGLRTQGTLMRTQQPQNPTVLRLGMLAIEAVLQFHIMFPGVLRRCSGV